MERKKMKRFHNAVGLVVEHETYIRLKEAAAFKKVSMSKLIRQGIWIMLAKIDKEK